MKSSLKNLIFILLVAIVSSCTNNTDNSNTSTPEETTTVSTESNLLQISKDQFKAEKMELGNAEIHTFNKVFKTNGVVTAAPQSKADVYSYLSGMIKQINVIPGNYVRRGQTLITIESKEFINLQRQYLEALSQQKAVEAAYKRVKELYEEKISSQKEYYDTESKYRSLNAKIQAIKAELKIVNVNISKLEEGNISTYMSILAPISGYVSNLECSIGEFISSEKMLLNLINSNKLQLHFYVYQETISNLKTGQEITIYSPDNSGKTYTATISSIGKSIDKESKSISCIADPENELKKIFVDGMYFQVEVVTGSTEGLALPNEAIMKSGDSNYILLKDKEDENNLYFKKAAIKTGAVDNKYTQILDKKELKNVLVKGTYYF